MKPKTRATKLRIAAAFSLVAIGALVLALSYPTLHRRFARVERDRALVAKLARPPSSTRSLIEWASGLGTDAVPVLDKALETKPSAFDKAYSWAWSNAPVSTRSNLPPPLDAAAADAIRVRASAALSWSAIGGHLPPPATIIKELRDPNWMVRMNALACLNNTMLPKSGPGGLGEDRETILTLLLSAAQDPQIGVRMSAIYCLGYFREDPDRVIPVLSKALTDHSPDVRIRAAMAFDTLDPEHAQSAGVISVARNCLESDGWRYSTKRFAEDFLTKKGVPSNEPP